MAGKKGTAPPRSGGPGRKADPLSAVYRGLNSIHLTVFLFIVLGVVSIIGTLIEQGADPATYARRYSPATIRLFEALGLFDMYHTPWFFALLLLLVLNLTVCTLERLPKVFRILRGVKPVLEPGDEKRYPFADRLRVGAGAAERAERALRRLGRVPPWILVLDAAALAAAAVVTLRYSLNPMEFTAFVVIPLLYVALLNTGGRLVRSEVQGTVYLFVQRGGWSRFGVYVTHASILVIFAGAITGNLFGFKGFVAVPEGQTQNQIFLRQQRLVDLLPPAVASAFPSKGTLVINADGHDHGDRPFLALPFSIRCNDFSVTYYDDTGRPKDYKSDLSVLRDGREVLRKTIEVNDPLVVDDIYFYQSSYGPTGEPGWVVLDVTPPGGEARRYRARVGESFAVEGTDTRIKVVSFVPDFDVVGNNVVQRSNELINPALYLSADNGGRLLFSGWLIPKHPEYDSPTAGYGIRFVDYWGWQYTGLQVAYDPGVEVVWIGCSLLVVGLLVSFFHSHERVWARVRDHEVVLAASTHKNRAAFEERFAALVAEVRGQGDRR